MTRWMRTVTGIAACLAMLPGLAGSASARQAPSTLYVIFNDIRPCASMPFPNCVTTRVIRATVGPAGGRVDWVRDAPRIFDIKEAYVTPDGGTLVYLGISSATGPGVYLHDVATGQTTTVAPFHGAGTLLGNPVRPEVYLFDGTGATVLSPSGTRRIDLPCPPNHRAGISADGRHASITTGLCPPLQPNTSGVIVFDTATGAIVSSQPYYGKVSAAGDELVTRDFSNGVFLLQRRALASGQVIAEVSNPGFEMIIDTGTGDVVTYNRGGSAHVMDGTTLGDRWSTTLGSATAANGPEPVLDPANGMLFSGDGHGISLADTRGRRYLGNVLLPALLWHQLAVGPPPPLAPVGLTSTVSGNAVSLSWGVGGPPAAVTRYVLEVGSAPGMNDIFTGLDVGLRTSFAAGGVPPGRYYVRVRAGNHSGIGAPSNEVIVQVP